MNIKGGVDLKSLGIDLSTEEGRQKVIDEGKKERLEEQTTPATEFDQCQQLINSVKCRIAQSKIHGVGVFAIKDIQKGETVECAVTSRPVWYKISLSNLKKHIKKVRPELYTLILDRWPNVVNDMPFLNPNYDARLTSFMNHSDNPNYDILTDTALKDIKAGEEVLEDYRVMKNWELAFPWLVEK